jgi:hypothetical protein
LGLAITALLVAAGAQAHGNLAMESDYCKLRVGPYVVHFTGYLPEGAAATKEFCEDIPSTGRALIVLDYVDAALRDLPVSFRIVDADSPDGPPVIDVPARQYPNGTLAVEHRFDRAGRFVGVLSVRNGADAVARFPFSVGSPMGAWHLVLGATAAIVLLAGVYLFGQRQRKTASAVR